MATPTSNSVPWTIVDGSTTGDAQYLIAGTKWGAGGLGTGVTLTYSFIHTGAGTFIGGYGDGESANYSALDATAQAAARAALASWSALAGVTFVQYSDNASTVGEIRFGMSESVGEGAAAHAYYPGGNVEAGDVWINPTYWNDDGGGIPRGSYDFNVLLHEIGHALGLKHSFEDTPIIPAQYDSYKYTVMSYTAWTGSGDNYASFYPTTPMYYDILAIQALYGVKAYQTGNNVYTFNQGTTYFQTIYDSGGIDGIVYNGTRACVINLNNGAFSSLSDPIFFNNGLRSNSTVCIGPNTIIENATGGGGNDLLVGNAANNQLIGGLGVDDMLGGAGNDIYSIDNLRDVVTENASAGTDTIRTSVTLTLRDNFENLVLLGSGIINGVGNALANTMSGNSAVNFLNGNGGADLVNGGAGNDVLYGGLGADRFVFTTALASNVDRIGDFNVLDDTILLENAIFTGLAAGVLAADAFRIGGAAADATDRIIYNSNTGALLFDSNGNAAGGGVQFATLTAHLALTNNDFLIV